MRNPNVKVLLTCVCACLLFSCKKDNYSSLLNAEDNVVETLAPFHRAVSATIDNNCAGFYETLPARYDSSTKKYPLIVFVHGIGELGNGTSDLPNMLRTGLPRLINKKLFPPNFEVDGKNYSFLVLSPQFKKRPTSAQLHNVIKYATNKYRIDTSRIYITGLSMGGGVTWEYAAEYGNVPAAVVPICGGSWPEPKRTKAIASFDLPVWAFHNNDDKTVPISYSVDYVEGINSYHPSTAAKLTNWTTGGHDAWTKAYDPATKSGNKNIYEWMLGYSRHRVK